MKKIYSSASIAKIIYIILFLIFLSEGTYAVVHNYGMVALFSGIFAGIASTSLVHSTKKSRIQQFNSMCN